MKMYEHQEDAVNEILFEIDSGSKNIVLEAPTSFGKSLVIAELCKQLKGKCVVLVNIEPLIDQIAEHLDAIDVKYSILKAGREDEYDSKCDVQIVMSQTFYARQDSIKIEADYIIQDERHREFDTDRTRAIVNHLRPKSIIGVTGTPYDNTGYALEDAYYVRTTTITELENGGYVTPVKYFVPKWSTQLDLESLRMSGADYSGSAIDELMNTEEKLELIVESMNQMNAKDKKTLVFCNSIEQCDLVTEALIENGYSAGALHSQKTKNENKAILDSFRSYPAYDTHEVKEDHLTMFTDDCEPIKCLVSVSKLNVGFSVKDIQLGVMLRPTKVRSLYCQTVGRIIRPYQGKKYAEFLDLSGVVSEHGFHYENYVPPEKGNKKALAAAKATAEAAAIGNIVNEEPTEVTREMHTVFIEELKKKQENIGFMNLQDLSALYDMTSDVYKIVEIAYRINELKTGSSYNNKTIEWIVDNWELHFELEPTYKGRWIKALKTRAKNIVRDGKKLASLKYFVEFLYENKDNF